MDITRQQIIVLGQDRVDRFIRHNINHFSDIYIKKTENQIKDTINASINVGKRYKIVREKEIRKLIELAMIYGEIMFENNELKFILSKYHFDGFWVELNKKCREIFN